MLVVHWCQNNVTGIVCIKADAWYWQVIPSCCCALCVKAPPPPFFFCYLNFTSLNPHYKCTLLLYKCNTVMHIFNQVHLPHLNLLLCPRYLHIRKYAVKQQCFTALQWHFYILEKLHYKPTQQSHLYVTHMRTKLQIWLFMFELSEMSSQFLLRVN